MIDRKARHDIAIGVGTSICTVVLNLLVVPVYVRFLGVEAYGLVGFLALLQGILSLFALGFAPTVSREVARGFGIADHQASRALLASLGRIYWVCALVIGVAGAALAPTIAAHWLNAQALDQVTVTRAITLMAVILALRWPSGIYFGAVVGAHRVTAGNIVNLLVTLGTALFGVLLTYWFRQIELLFVVNLVAAACQVLAMRHLAWRSLGPATERWCFQPIRNIWRYSTGMGLITVMAVLLTQGDKLLVSKLLSLQAFGLLSLANVVGRSLYQLTAPINNVVYPRLSSAVAAGDLELLRTNYLQWTGMFCAVFYPASLFLVLADQPLLTIWLHNAATASAVAPLASLIAIGAALHGAMLFPFSLQIAFGDARTPLLINVIVVAIYIPLLIWLIDAYGVLGAAAAWPILMTIYVAVATWLTHRKALPDLMWRWLGFEIGIPLGVCALFGMIVHLLVRAPTPIAGIVIDTLVSGVALIACVMIFLHRHMGLRGVAAFIGQFRISKPTAAGDRRTNV